MLGPAGEGRGGGGGGGANAGKLVCFLPTLPLPSAQNASSSQSVNALDRFWLYGFRRYNERTERVLIGVCKLRGVVVGRF